MSNELVAQVIDASTGESVTRPFTPEELEVYEAHQNEQAILSAEKQAKEEARTSALAKLAALGLTEEEIAAL